MASTIASRLTRVRCPLVKSPSFRPPLRGQTIIPTIGSLASTGRPGLPGKTTPTTLSTTTFLRSFQHSVPQGRNCDWGRPCDCSECYEDYKRPICDICSVNPTAHQNATFSIDRKNIPYYSFTSYCEECWAAERSKAREEKRPEKEWKAEPRNDALLSMRGIIARMEPGDQVPIAYAVQKLKDAVESVRKSGNSRQWYQRHLRERLGEELRITKVRGRYQCDKKRVDAMDFKLWFFGDSK
ncbi:hypothetical protein QBC41DRAFT_115472 [Cercophora samala]|uniref:Uncharacterized protein n=1 Tax=Cercophora samala TaxID=330535 RepID=A0AA40DE57_9PEZI|nr:hypothetical protein QBC41DRAFT_115472 [Cercophora samala]